jgi:hypothetical protein
VTTSGTDHGGTPSYSSRVASWRTRWVDAVTALAPTAWWRLNDLASPPTTNTYTAAALALSPIEHWSFADSGLTQTGIVASKVMTCGASVLRQQTGSLIGGTQYGVDCGTVSSTAYDVGMAPGVDSSFLTASFSVAFWVKPTAIGSAGTAYDFVNRNGSVGYGVYATDAAVGFYTVQGGVNSFYEPAYVMLNNVWQHIVVTYNVATQLKKVYVNGSLIGTSGVTVFDNTLGNGSIAVNRNFLFGTHGKSSYDELSFYGTVLTPAQIASLFVLGRPVAERGALYPGGQIGAPLTADGVLQPGDSDAAFDFSGTIDRALVPYNAALNPASFTIAGWIKRDVDTGAVEYVAGCITGFTGFDFTITAADRLQIVTGTGAGFASITGGTTTLATGTWYFVAATFTAGTAALYINGALEVSGAIAYSANTTSPLMIASSPAGANLLNGKIDELMFWNSALSAAQILALYTTWNTAAPLVTPNPTIPTPTAVTTPSYTLVMTDQNGVRVGEPWRATDIVMGFGLNQATTLAMKMNSLDDDLAQAIVEDKTRILMYQDATLIGHVVVGPCTDDFDASGEAPTETVSVTAADPLSQRLARRTRQNESAYGRTAGTSRTFTAVDAVTIAKQLIDDENTRYATGVRTGTVTLPTTTSKTLTFDIDKNVMQAIADMANAYDGFDYGIVPISTVPYLGDFMAWARRGISRANIAFEWGGGKENIVRATVVNDTAKLSTDTHAVGQAIAGVATRSDTTFLDGRTSYGTIFDTVETFSDISDTTLLGVLSQQFSRWRQVPKQVVSFQPAQTADYHPIRDFDRGDYIGLKIIGGRFRDDNAITGAIRVYGFTISLDITGKPTYTIICQPNDQGA